MSIKRLHALMEHALQPEELAFRRDIADPG